MRRIPASSLVALFLAAVLPFAACSGRDAQNAEKSPQAATYLAYVEAVKAGNVQAWKKVVPAKQVDGLAFWCEMTKKTPEQHVASFAGDSPDELRFTSVSVKGNEATLRLTGKRKSGAKVKGEILLLLEDGDWKVASQSYDN
jgi:hypothetical protein